MAETTVKRTVLSLDATARHCRKVDAAVATWENIVGMVPESAAGPFKDAIAAAKAYRKAAALLDPSVFSKKAAGL